MLNKMRLTRPLRHGLYECVIVFIASAKFIFLDAWLISTDFGLFSTLLHQIIYQKIKNMKTSVLKSFLVVSVSLAVVILLSRCTQPAAEKVAGAPDKDLHMAVISHDLEAVKKHIEVGSDLNAKEPFGGSTPLITAALFGDEKAAELLMAAGADLNLQNNDGSTAVHVAAFFCRPQILKMLLDKGANKNLRNNYGSTAYESVAGPYADLAGIYQMMGEQLAPMGLKLDYAYIEQTRPEVAQMLKD